MTRALAWVFGSVCLLFLPGDPGTRSLPSGQRDQEEVLAKPDRRRSTLATADVGYTGQPTMLLGQL